MGYFRKEIQDGICILWLDQPDSQVNTLSVSLLTEFTGTVETLAEDDAIEGVVLASAKKDSFIAGADIHEFHQMKSSDEAYTLSHDGNAMLLKLERMSKPVIAAIHGAALGGGLEVALACHYRIASEHPKTVLGLPEVTLGLLPGGGGTQRLPRLVGLSKALDMMLTGRRLFARQAYRAGVVDELIHPQGLIQAAIKAAREGRKAKGKKSPIPMRWLEALPPGRELIYSMARKAVMKKTRGLYPAPESILRSVQAGMDHGLEAGLETESREFAKLHGTPQCQQLTRLFTASQDQKNIRFDSEDVLPEKLAVLGAGFMGAGISQVSVEKGLDVILKDVSDEALARGLASIDRNWLPRVKKRVYLPFQKDRMFSRIQPTLEMEDIAGCELVVEAVFEDLALKHKVVKEVEAVCGEETVFASNTSSLPISRIAEASKRPENMIGLHYFSPVPKMPLLEIIVTDKTSERSKALAWQLALRQGKTPVLVNDGPGFYTTRILTIYMQEALQLMHEGARTEAIDEAMKNWGFPVGPMALMDEVGIDVGAHIARGDLAGLFASRGLEQDDVMQRMVDDGLLGRKSGSGFYLYPKRGRKKVNERASSYFKSSPGDMPEAEIQLRLSAIMVNEALLCLDEKIVERPVDADLAAVLGLGFPPFRGGPCRYVDSLGKAAFGEQLERLQEKYGDRFKPAACLAKKSSFYRG